MSATRPFTPGRSMREARRRASEGHQSQDEYDDGQGEWSEWCGDAFHVASAQVADDRADEVGDEPCCGGDAEGFEPEADEDAGGAGEFKSGEDGEQAKWNADSAVDRCDRSWVVFEFHGC